MKTNSVRSSSAPPHTTRSVRSRRGCSNFSAVSGGLLACLPLELKLRGKSTTQSFRSAIYYVDLGVRAAAHWKKPLSRPANLMPVARQPGSIKRHWILQPVAVSVMAHSRTVSRRALRSPKSSILRLTRLATANRNLATPEIPASPRCVTNWTERRRSVGRDGMTGIGTLPASPDRRTRVAGLDLRCAPALAEWQPVRPSASPCSLADSEAGGRQNASCGCRSA